MTGRKQHSASHNKVLKHWHASQNQRFPQGTLGSPQEAVGPLAECHLRGGRIRTHRFKGSNIAIPKQSLFPWWHETRT